ncbi:hypothetical protein P170DRAFT_435034 [Aspergillus steynii IBT 23096]|uniref:Uncharacterized protein n=1 Tax=Aspergillus steynii IBT 23096 TaxID=1392250 RepID=A0A2I2GKK8_9EURO|nr:uncharacterized protein P170DRAFT_435034 [Aspergillus steynii IBT 23096]PLB53389.1 hypothetical protein P170DRAFT_435034 [Aspergillus steynii IBT 23096]
MWRENQKCRTRDNAIPQPRKSRIGESSRKQASKQRGKGKLAAVALIVFLAYPLVPPSQCDPVS